MRALLLLPLVLLAAACGSSTTASPPTTKTPASGKNGPPAAWIETKAGRSWLGFSSYCWKQATGGLCADAAAPMCGQQGVPDVKIQSGETVRAHLGYTPSEASVDNGFAKLEGRTVTWRVTEAGPFVLFTKDKERDASYVACARFG